MFEIGDNIVHDTLGKGEIVDIAVYDDDIVYLEIHFEKDPKYKTRMFTEESIKSHLI